MIIPNSWKNMKCSKPPTSNEPWNFGATLFSDKAISEQIAKDYLDIGKYYKIGQLDT